MINNLLSNRYGVQVASAMFVFVMMWILLVTLDHGLVDAKHFGTHTKTTFWVSESIDQVNIPKVQFHNTSNTILLLL